MIIPSNLNLKNNEKIKFEEFIQRNKSNITGILVLLDINPFKNKLKLSPYYTYILTLAKKYKLRTIGFFNESTTLQFKKNLKEDILNFEKEFSVMYHAGIKTIIRPSNWYNFNFHRFNELGFYAPSESNKIYLQRLYNNELFFEHLDYLENGIDKEFEKKIYKTKSKYEKTLSIAHPDNTYKGKLFYEFLKNSNERFLSEIDDIYFGKDFIYDDGIKYIHYGNVMGVQASDEQLDYLFKIQEELGISISLTLNALNPPLDLIYDEKVLKQFILFLKRYYDKGLRVCTISDIHLIKTGILQKHFPDMRFKNTVNHKIMDTQTFINYANLGYDYIQLDRSLVRNLNELKRIKKANLKYKRKLYLLSAEYCMYNCPFKGEHDLINEQIQDSTAYFNGEQKLSHISCDNWRHSNYANLPRIGVDLMLKDEDMADEYLKYMDIFKLSGRLINLESVEYLDKKIYINGFDCFEDKLKYDKQKRKISLKFEKTTNEENRPSIYTTKEGEELLDTLLNCRNQCYACHKCEEVFKMEPFDSLIDIKQENFF